jgi:hypothetical protein
MAVVLLVRLTSFRFVDAVKPKGFGVPVRIFELLRPLEPQGR